VFARLTDLGAQFGSLKARLQWAMSVHCAAALVLPVLDFAVEPPGPGEALREFGADLRTLAELLSATLVEPERDTPSSPG